MRYQYCLKNHTASADAFQTPHFPMVPVQYQIEMSQFVRKAFPPVIISFILTKVHKFSKISVSYYIGVHTNV